MQKMVQNSRGPAPINVDPLTLTNHFEPSTRHQSVYILLRIILLVIRDGFCICMTWEFVVSAMYSS
jgi:hypothetical protein